MPPIFWFQKVHSQGKTVECVSSHMDDLADACKLQVGTDAAGHDQREVGGGGQNGVGGSNLGDTGLLFLAFD